MPSHGLLNLMRDPRHERLLECAGTYRGCWENVGAKLLCGRETPRYAPVKTEPTSCLASWTGLSSPCPSANRLPSKPPTTPGGKSANGANAMGDRRRGWRWRPMNDQDAQRLSLRSYDQPPVTSQL